MAWVAFSACGYSALERLADVAADGAADALPDAPYMSIDGPSCPVTLARTCGSGANESCCRAALVPGGTFYRSYDGAGYKDQGFPATVSTFALDKYEVTVGRFRAFVNAGLGTRAAGSAPAAGAGAHPQLPGSGWDMAWNARLVPDTTALVSAVKCNSTYQTWTDTPEANENKAMSCVTWYEAMAFCIWDGGYLATEAEWNYAASGGPEQRVYPWSQPASSTSIDCMYANYYNNNPPGTYCVNGMTGGVNRVGSESPKGDGRWGHADLAGNVWEWVFDWYSSPYPNPQNCIDCANLMPASDRVLRGGGLGAGASQLRAAGRDNANPADRFYSFGWRCARTP